ncbi:MAG TPA: hypothetical protein DD417_13860 [Elusimicrobia bacterium]|nr:hypothetical protein [Elusimicrobiota bacterium]
MKKAVVICPGCTSEIDAVESACPVCMRPRSQQEVFASLRGGIGDVRSSRSRRRLFLVLGALTIAASLKIGREIRPPGRATEAAEPQRSPAAVPQPDGNAWVVEGRVYDLVTLSPVADAQVSFRSVASGDEREAQTDAAGRYRVSLPKIQEGGYAVSFRRQGYGDRYLEDMSPAYESQSAEARREVLTMLDSTKILHVPLLPDEGETRMEYDMVVRGTGLPAARRPKRGR